MNDDIVDIRLRSAADVATRCIILGALLNRAALEESAGEAESELAAEAFDLRGWLHTEGLWDELTPKEKTFLSARLGAIPPEDVVAASWQGAGLDALAWALGLLPSLPPTGLGDFDLLVHELPHPWQKTGPWIAARGLRPEREIAREREIAEIWEWRVSMEMARRLAEGRDLETIEQAIATTTQEGQAAGLLAPGKSGGFRSGEGVSITRAGLDELDRLTAITTERLLALNWLCGFGDNWDDVPLEV